MYAKIKLFRNDGTVLLEVKINPLEPFQCSFMDPIVHQDCRFLGYKFTPHVEYIREPLEGEKR